MSAASSAGLTMIVTAPLAAPFNMPFHVPANLGGAIAGLGFGAALAFVADSGGVDFDFFDVACALGPMVAAGVGFSGISWIGAGSRCAVASKRIKASDIKRSFFTAEIVPLNRYGLRCCIRTILVSRRR